MIVNITELCVNCKQNNSCTMCWKTSKKKCPHFIQKTNADRIRAMSDDELAEMLIQYDDFCDVYMADDGMKYYDFEAAKEAELEWLQQPAEE